MIFSNIFNLSYVLDEEVLNKKNYIYRLVLKSHLKNYLEKINYLQQ